ncbi:protein of unknown function [Methylocaldum szegediense]|uniref:Uncharacterized protein n=1 Tax=Methylocaldum szegediense TaxID=73780 RepID=A0ABM9I116_9GAMM|nr:protein of unknown function [Methylocaldum szegediense]
MTLTVIAGQRELLERTAIEAFYRNDMHLLGQTLAVLEPKGRLRLLRGERYAVDGESNNTLHAQPDASAAGRCLEQSVRQEVDSPLDE